jgi:ABC-type Co2+ transport system permease subunit
MTSRIINKLWFQVGLTCVAALFASAQSLRVQCPTSTITHPSNGGLAIGHFLTTPAANRSLLWLKIYRCRQRGWSLSRRC